MRNATLIMVEALTLMILGKSTRGGQRMINPTYSIEEIEKRFFTYLKEKIGDFKIVEHLHQLKGGYEAYLYSFEISGAKCYDRKLVLRLFPSYVHPESATWQAMIHNLLSEEGLPVPKVYLSTSDYSILGGPFLVMEYVEGETIDPIEYPSVLVLTAKTQAMLHTKDGKRISEKIMAHGHSAESHNFDGRIKRLKEKRKKYPELDEAIKWLIDNRPPDPKQPKIIHGDFHPMNLLVKDGKVSAILDWSGFMVGDPMYGLGWTKALFIATGKPQLSENTFNQLIQLYTEAYESIHPIDYSKMEYFAVFRLVRALIEGKDGQEVWTQPIIVDNILREIKKMTGIQIDY
jgi:aminoglycoside phosphotransferase (APT) family kinase protein